MSEIVESPGSLALPVRRIDVERPWQWLAAGWRDFTAAPMVSLLYGGVFVLGGLILTFLLWSFDWLYLLLPIGAGFLLLAPVLATGLYEVSRRLERGERPSLGDAFQALQKRPGSLAVMGLVLVFFFLTWIRIAFLIFALFFGAESLNWTRSRCSSSALTEFLSSLSAPSWAESSQRLPSRYRRYRFRLSWIATWAPWPRWPPVSQRC